MKLIAKDRFNSFAVTIIIASFIALSLPVYAQASASASKQSGVTINAGETWKVTETTSLDGLTVYDGAIITALDGYSLSMTVDGVKTEIKPGNYNGQIMLMVTRS